jgi:hypothetical protein
MVFFGVEPICKTTNSHASVFVPDHPQITLNREISTSTPKSRPLWR